MYSKVIQLYTHRYVHTYICVYIYIYIFLIRFSSCIGYCKIWFLVLYNRFLLVIYFIHSSVYVQQLELDMEQQTGSKYEKEYVKAVYCHPAYLTSMQSTS